MESPLISVIMPAYNCERYISKAIESVLEQSYSRIELIVIDDASSDNTSAIIQVYADVDNRVNVITQAKNQGVAIARNAGIAAAQGKYIALIDSDDVWTLDKLERQIALIESKNAQIAYCSYGFMDEADNVIHRPFIVPEETDYEHMLTSSVISCSTALIEAGLMKRHPFNPNYYHEDYVLWMELLEIPVIAVGDKKVLAYYRQLKGSRSHHKANAAIEKWRIYTEVLKLGYRKSSIVFLKYAINGIRKYYLAN